MTITIDIPAISELAAAIRYHADSQRQPSVREALAAMTAEALGANDPPADTQPVTAEAAPAKRTRRTKAEMDAERKAIEETKGRRVDLIDPSRPVESQQLPAGEGASEFQWTLELLKDTFLAITPEDDSQEAKDAANAKLLALRQIREAIAPEAQNLSTMDEKHYAEFAKQATAWYREQGLELKLPEGCEL